MSSEPQREENEQFKRLIAANISWQMAGDSDVIYCTKHEGKQLHITSVFDEAGLLDSAYYVLTVAGNGEYRLSEWPSTWCKPRNNWKLVLYRISALTRNVFNALRRRRGKTTGGGSFP